MPGCVWATKILIRPSVYSSVDGTFISQHGLQWDTNKLFMKLSFICVLLAFKKFVLHFLAFHKERKSLTCNQLISIFRPGPKRLGSSSQKFISLCAVHSAISPPPPPPRCCGLLCCIKLQNSLSEEIIVHV